MYKWLHKKQQSNAFSIVMEIKNEKETFCQVWTKKCLKYSAISHVIFTVSKSVVGEREE